MSTTYYNTIARSYNGLHGEEQKKKLEVVRSLLHPKPRDLLLDIGCGTGISSDWPCQVVGIDPTKKLLAIANETYPLPRFILCSAEKLPFKDRHFDYSICITALHNFSSPLNAMHEMKRVVKSKNRNIVISLLLKSPSYPSLCVLIKQNFNVQKIIETHHDTIFLLQV